MTTLELGIVLAEERRIMNLYAPQYRKALLANSYMYRRERQAFTRWLRQTLSEAGQDLTRLSVLDVGCGTGEVLALLFEYGCRLTGFDLAESMLSEARQRRLPGVRLVQGTVEEHDFEDQKFDVVVAAFTVHHLLDPRAFFLLVHRVLKPGGWFFLLDYNARAWAFSGRTQRPIYMLTAPLRILLRWKNRKKLAQQSMLPQLFNPAHRLLAFDDILAALPQRTAYQIRQKTRGLLLHTLNYVLFEDMPFDRGVVRLLDRIDRAAEFFCAGNFQWIAGQRIA